PFRMTSENFNRYDIPQWRDFWRNLKEGYDIFERTHRPPRVSVCENSYVFDPASQMEAANPPPVGACPTTEAMLRQRDVSKSRTAEQMHSLAQKTTSPSTRVAVSNTNQNSGEKAPQAVSTSPTEHVACSPSLASCRKYAALLDKRAKKQAVAAEEERIHGNRSIVPKNRRRAASRSHPENLE